MQTADHHAGIGAVPGVGLRVKEDFGVQHVVGMGPHQVGTGHVVEVLLGAQHLGACVVDVQEALQVVEHVGAAQRINIRVRKIHPVARGQREDEFGLQRALDVHVQLCLGHGPQQSVQPVGGDRFDFH